MLFFLLVRNYEGWGVVVRRNPDNARTLILLYMHILMKLLENMFKVHRYSFWKIERVIRICLKFQKLFKDLFWAKWTQKINMSPGFLRFYDVF